MKQLSEAGFGNKVEMRLVEGCAEAATVEELAGNMMLFKDMFMKGWEEQELERAEVVLREELRALEGFFEEGRVGVKMVAWVGMAQK